MMSGVIALVTNFSHRYSIYNPHYSRSPHLFPPLATHSTNTNNTIKADYERAHKYPVAPHMDRTKTTRPRIAADFMDFVATPMFRILAEFLPASSMLLDYINANRQAWQKGLDDLTKDKDVDKKHKEEPKQSEGDSGSANGEDEEDGSEDTTTTTTTSEEQPETPEKAEKPENPTTEKKGHDKDNSEQT
jgi:hypothetical protein